MASIRDIRNIVGNVEQLVAYKKEVFSSTEKLILYWGWFIIGIWINEKTKELNFILNNFIFAYLPVIILWCYLIYICIRNMNTIYTSDKTIKEKMGLSKNEIITDIKFREYIKKFPVYHPILTVSIIGLFISQIYFMDEYSNTLNLLEQIPLIGSFYADRFSIVNLILLFVIGNYLDFIKTDLIRYSWKMVVYFNLPIIIAGEILGFCSIFVYPIISIFTNFNLIINFKYWLTNNTTNFLVMLIAPMVLIVLYRLTTIRELDEEINKFSDGDRGGIINENT